MHTKPSVFLAFSIHVHLLALWTISPALYPVVGARVTAASPSPPSLLVADSAWLGVTSVVVCSNSGGKVTLLTPRNTKGAPAFVEQTQTERHPASKLTAKQSSGQSVADGQASHLQTGQLPLSRRRVHASPFFGRQQNSPVMSAHGVSQLHEKQSPTRSGWQYCPPSQGLR